MEFPEIVEKWKEHKVKSDQYREQETEKQVNDVVDRCEKEIKKLLLHGDITKSQIKFEVEYVGEYILEKVAEKLNNYGICFRWLSSVCRPVDILVLSLKENKNNDSISQ